MEADWEFEVGGGAPVIEALWPGFVDLRRSPERIAQIQEAAAFPALAELLAALNGPRSPLWSAKCDLWEPQGEQPSSAPVALAAYVDLLPLAGLVFSQPRQAENLCRSWVALLDSVALPDCRVDLVIRQALAGETEGFGITAYLSAEGRDQSGARATLAVAMAAFSGSIPATPAPEAPVSKLE